MSKIDNDPTTMHPTVIRWRIRMLQKKKRHFALAIETEIRALQEQLYQFEGAVLSDAIEQLIRVGDTQS